MYRRMLSLFLFLGVLSAHAATITYTYDAQHRLVSADYSEAQPDTHVTYQYDAANNVELIMAISDSQWLQSFQLWLSSVWRGLEPRMNTSAHTSET